MDSETSSKENCTDALNLYCYCVGYAQGIKQTPDLDNIHSIIAGSKKCISNSDARISYAQGVNAGIFDSSANKN